MTPLAPNHFIRHGFATPRIIPYRGMRILATSLGMWRAIEAGGSCIYACPTIDGTDVWLISFATIKDAKMGIDRYISWLVTYRLMHQARSA